MPVGSVDRRLRNWWLCEEMNVRDIFLTADKKYFHSRLQTCTFVKWSERLVRTIGSTESMGNGMVTIRLSRPVLSLRSRKDMVETLVHEMIHAFLIVTDRDDNHGPNFQRLAADICAVTDLEIQITHGFCLETSFVMKARDVRAAKERQRRQRRGRVANASDLAERELESTPDQQLPDEEEASFSPGMLDSTAEEDEGIDSTTTTSPSA